jgi:hypothetical protein
LRGRHRAQGFDGFNGQDGLIAEVFELKNVDFSYNATDGYTIYRALIPQIFASDVILIYRMSGTIDSNTLFGNLSGDFSSLKVS